MSTKDAQAKISQAADLIEQVVNGLEQTLLSHQFIDIPEVNDIYNAFARIDKLRDLGEDHLRDFARIARAARLKNPPEEK